MSQNWAGSKLHINENELSKIIIRLTKISTETLENPNHYIKIHNTFTAYTVLLLLNASGHRPIVDPFCYWKDIDLNLKMALFDDKAINEQLRFRIVALVDIAVEQLLQYKNHLKWLASHTMIDPKAGNLHSAISEITNIETPRKKQQLPLFFLLEEKNNAIKTSSISGSSLKKTLGELWPLPFNFGRHNISTQLRYLLLEQYGPTLTVDAIEAHLGHIEQLEHPFGKASVLSPFEYQSKISAPLNELLINQGWKVIKSLRSFKKLKTKSGAKWKHANKELGPVARKIEREKEKLKDKVLVEDALKQYRVEDLISNPETIDLIRKNIIKQSSHDEDRVQTRLILLWKKLLRLKSIHPGLDLKKRVHILKSEAAPFSQNTISDYIYACECKKKFLKYLERRGSLVCSSNPITYYRRVAEILVSASLFDAITNKKHLNLLSESSFTLTREDIVTYMDVFRGKRNILAFRWLPQPLSVALVSRLESADMKHLRVKYFNENRLEKEAKLLFSEIGIDSNSEKSIDQILSHLGNAYWIMHMPSFLREIAFGNVPVTSLHESCLVRLIRNERLASKEEVVTEPRNKNNSTKSHQKIIDYIKANVTYRHGIKQSRRFLKDLKKDIKCAGKELGEKSTSVNVIRKKKLASLLRKRIKIGCEYPEVSVAIASWCNKLCTEGTDLNGPIVYKTVSEYTLMVAKRINELACDSNYFELEASQYDYFYDVALDQYNALDKSKLLNNLKDFHNFLVDAGLVIPLDWSDKTRLVKESKNESIVQARVITPTEYLKLIDLLEPDNCKENLTRKSARQHCAFIILGYRFGLRIAEIENLLFKDIQHSADWKDIVVHVRNNYFADKKSDAGHRQVPLIGMLTSVEKTVLRSVLSAQEHRIRSPSTAIFSRPEDPKELIDTYKITGNIQKLLKQITGDPTSHFHLLRHSYNCRIASQLFDINAGSYNDFINILSGRFRVNSNQLRLFLTERAHESNSMLAAQSSLTGHSHITTTFTHYIHTTDFHIHHLCNQQKHWESGNINRIDYITAYASGTKWTKAKKQRERKGINSTDLLNALNVCNSYFNFQKSGIETIPHPENEVLLMPDTNKKTIISVLTINDVLLAYVEKDNPSLEQIAEVHHLDIENMKALVNVFKEAKDETNYLGLNHKKGIKGKPQSSYDKEDSNDNFSVHNALVSLNRKLKTITDLQKEMLASGIKAWINGYYPRNRYRPTIFQNPQSVIDYLNVLAFIGIDTSRLHIRVPEQAVEWCKELQSVSDNPDRKCEPSNVEITLNGNKQTFICKSYKSVNFIPWPLDRKRVVDPERISISLGGQKKSEIKYKRQLDRICFVFLIWLKLQKGQAG